MNHIKDNLKLIFGIVEEDQGRKLEKAVSLDGILGGVVVLAHGTVRNKIMNLLGLTDRRKDLCILVTTEEQEAIVYEKFDKKMVLHEHGHGIAFSVPIYRAIHANTLYESDLIPQKENEGETMSGYEAIIAVTDFGSSDEVIAAAKKQGATGGTIIHARGTANPNNPKLFGMDVEPEKEIVLILADHTQTTAIMESIHEAMGLDAPNSGIVFTIDVTKSMGLLGQ